LRQGRLFKWTRGGTCCATARRVTTSLRTGGPREGEEGGEDQGDKSSSLSSTSSSTHVSNRVSNRRTFLVTSSLPLIAITARPEVAKASLFPFPVPDNYIWSNKYTIIRAGTTEKEESNVLESNPLFLTNRVEGNIMSKAGVAEIESSISLLRLNPPTIIKHPLSAAAIDTSNQISQSLHLGRDRVVPEFTFMDGRGAGLYNGLPLNTTSLGLLALDEEGGRVPEKEDGTPSEVLSDVMVRLRQLMSVLETQYGGESILLVFNDGVTGGVLMAAMAGEGLEKGWKAEMGPGEVWGDVDQRFAKDLFKDEKRMEKYKKRLERGKVELGRMRRMEENGTIRTIEEVEFEEGLVESARLEEDKNRREAEDEKREMEEGERRRVMAEDDRLMKIKEQEMRREEVRVERMKKVEEDKRRREEVRRERERSNEEDRRARKAEQERLEEKRALDAVNSDGDKGGMGLVGTIGGLGAAAVGVVAAGAEGGRTKEVRKWEGRSRNRQNLHARHSKLHSLARHLLSLVRLSQEIEKREEDIRKKEEEVEARNKARIEEERKEREEVEMVEKRKREEEEEASRRIREEKEKAAKDEEEKILARNMKEERFQKRLVEEERERR
jgi:hypothetical protein